MRALILVQNYPPERGAVRYAANLAAGLARRSHAVRVVTGLPHYPEGRPHPSYGRWRVRRHSQLGVEVVRVPLVMGSNQQIGRRLAGMVSFPLTAVLPAMTGPRPDAVIASVPPLPVAALGVAVAARYRAPLVMLVRDVEPKISLELRGLETSWPGRAAIRAAMRLYDRADYLVTAHESQESSLTEYGIAARKVETIRHGIDVDGFRALAAGPSPLPSVMSSRLRLVYAGSLGVAHDVDRLVGLFAREDVRRLAVDFTLVGQGERAPECDRVIRDARLEHVRRIDPVALEAVPALLAQADVLVTSYRTLPRHIPGMIGSKLYEYCAAGKPILVHGAGVAADLVRDVGNGVVVPAGDSAALIAAIATLSAPARREEMGIRGLAYAREQCDERGRHDRWHALLTELSTGRHRRRATNQKLSEKSG